MLSVHDLACERGDRLLFRNIGFELGQGEALLVRGGNGRGKTSLLRILCGLSAPAAGEVIVRGDSCEGRSVAVAEPMVSARGSAVCVSCPSAVVCLSVT